jgi:DNA-binding response OmpR family regulator
MPETNREVILTTVTDRSQLELLSQELGREGYEVVAATSLTELITKIKKGSKISLAVVDVPAFGQEIQDGLEALNKSGIPFIVISERSPSIQKHTLRSGARGLFTRGIRLTELLEHIHTLLGKKIL